MPVAEVGRDHVLAVLQPLWRGSHETALKTRARIASILDYATAKGWRPEGLNPARWRGNLDRLLRRQPVGAETRHHAALPWAEAPAFVAALQERGASAARMLELVVLTACRSNEARGACWREVDLDRAIWTIPPSRSKTGVEHRIPLAPAAVALLRRQLPPDGRLDPEAPVFPGVRDRPQSAAAMVKLLERMQARTPRSKARWRDADGRPITVHGFRSTFRDWCEEATSTPHAVSEAALAHAIPSQVEAAYRRGDLFAKRRALMQEWADFCSRAPAEVVALRPAAAEQKA